MILSFYKILRDKQRKNALLLFMLLACMSITQDKLSAAPVSAACDVNFLTQLQNNALLQAERQVLRGNVLIRKPDSVLEYTCFDQHSAFIAQSIGPVFSEYSWDFKGYNVFMGDTHLDDAIDNLVLSTLQTYITSNFAHDFLGGALSGSNNTISSTVAGAGSACSAMYSVFHSAKCEDFAPDLPFTDFAGLVAQTPRALPSPCGSAHKITQALIDLANNVGGAVVVDPVNPYLNYMQIKAATGCLAVNPIPTGIKIQFSEHDLNLTGKPVVVNSYTYEDKVCANPACYFDHKNTANGGDDVCR